MTTVPVYTAAGKSVTITPDLSRTYVWCGDTTIPPYTEQYQFTGDPRDCPYLDVKTGGISMTNAAVTIAPNGYNWWFKERIGLEPASMMRMVTPVLARQARVFGAAIAEAIFKLTCTPLLPDHPSGTFKIHFYLDRY